MSLDRPKSLHFKIHLGWGLCSHPGEGPRVGQVWEKIPDNWPAGRQRPRRNDLYKWLNHLFAVRLLTRGGAHTLSLGFRLSALLLCLLDKLLLCVLAHLLLFYVSNNKIYIYIYSFYLHEKCIFHQVQRSRDKEFLVSSPCQPGG